MHLFDTPSQQPSADGTAPDAELDRVAKYLLSLDPEGRRFADALRSTFDMLLDGQHTGRYRWDQLYKTEKTHFGTLVEINLQRKFDFSGGEELDYRICGIDVDCKYSQKHGSWMIPPEAVGKLCLVLWASDTESRWSAGLVRASEELLGGGRNRDGKRTLSRQGRQAVKWLFADAPLPVNALLHLPKGEVEAIFAPGSGTKRVDELFRRAQGILIRRVVVATVAQQEDYMKRIRGNGGSRSSLRPEGIIILGQYKGHAAIAEQLGLPVPGRGESVSARVVRAGTHTGEERPKALISGDWWVLATDADPAEPAPRLPKV
ncbi:NaeI family type II restriction endonuclease [Nocardiopsis sp. NRRL B-16309]|uniref:NaeI family type II restriction endonuclease n=1 Tax=Nocardiopsis sp. NRRL B-16309 TaxID=1519494 RepID=UPI0006AD8646|nr:NaeI family type II restriction endonuclease [Nocardiopsis sp. NRRL B-16309]